MQKNFVCFIVFRIFYNILKLDDYEFNLIKLDFIETQYATKKLSLSFIKYIWYN